MELPQWLSVPVLSSAIGGAIALLFLSNYLRRKRAEVATISQLSSAPPPADLKPAAASKPPKKGSQRHHHPDKDANKKHHPLDLNTLKGHTDSVTALSFSADSHNLATACADGAIRVFRIDDTSSKSFKTLKINLHAGVHPTGIVFSDGASSVIIAGQALAGSSLYSYGDVSGKAVKGKQSQPEIQWEHPKIHGMESVLNLSSAVASYGSSDGSTIVASCSEESEIKVWDGKTGKLLGAVETNQLKNNMAKISANGRFLAAAAFTADVKVWEIVYSKDSSVKEVIKVMQLKGHKSAVTSLCFMPNSEQIITASKDGTIRIWNINVRYHLDEDPKTLKVFPIPLHDAKGTTCHYDHMSISPDGKVLAVTSSSTLQWLHLENGSILDTAEKAHEGDITDIAWAPLPIPNAGAASTILATAGNDRKVKLWLAPSVNAS